MTEIDQCVFKDNSTHWVRLNYIRATLALLGWLAALKALSLSG